MKPSKNTNKIVMKQPLTPTPIFSRVKSLLILPAVLISTFILPPYAGAVQADLANPSISEADITELKNDLRTANTAKASADGAITTLKEQLTTANNAKASADNMITNLREQLTTAFGDTNTPDGTITTLKEQLTTANNAKASADNMITTLRGQLSTAFRDSNTADADVLRLTEELRLAEEARLQEIRDNLPIIDSADWGGVADAPKPDVINKDNTGTLPLLNGVTSVGNGNPRLNFIQGLPTVEGKGFDFTGTAFADASVTGDVLLLGADSPSGVAFSRVSGTGVTGAKFYTGLLPTTTLGAPISNPSSSAFWDAKVMVMASFLTYSNPSFKMQVTFDGNEGTINSGKFLDQLFTPGRITVSTRNSGSADFNIQGRFGNDGLLYGTIRLGVSAAEPLTGLIGVDGAVGAFIGGDSRNNPYAGGFVAYPTAPFTTPEQDMVINFADWGGTAGAPKTTVINADNTDTLPLLNGAASVGNSNPTTNFIQGLARVDGKGFDFAGTAFSDASVFGDVLLLGEDNPSGVAFSRITRTDIAGRITFIKFYTGQLPTTTLGAPITDINTSAIWDAKATAIFNSALYSNANFKMRVIFSGSEGTINSGTVTGDSFTNRGIELLNPYSSNLWLNIQGKFDTDGLLYGKVVLNGSNGALTGLIGEEGAVGTFLGNFAAGGFVAYPDTVDYTDWVAAMNPDAAPDLANPRSQFLQGNDGTLDTTGVTACRDSNNHSICGAVGSRKAAYVFSGNLNQDSFDGRRIGGDINDGYAYFFGYIGETPQYDYVGILDSTHLGLPLKGDADTSVQWNGRGSSWRDFVLNITFDDNGGRLDAFIGISNTNQFFRFQNVRFDTGGLITGTINAQRFTDSDPTKPTGTANNYVLSGLIGQEGAVAVYLSTSSLGGFIAGPDIALNPDVRESDWLRKIGNIRQAATSVPRNQFLNTPTSNLNTTGVRANSDGRGRVTAEALNLNTATFNGNRLNEYGFDRVEFFNGYNGGIRHYYAGIDSNNTNWGATLPVWQTGQPASAEWKGQFSVLQGANTRANADLTLEVNFENRKLTAFVPVGANHYLLDAGFNADDDGFFAGTVNFGVFTDTTNRTSTNTLTPGVLTGIIGVEGAMGVFVSGSTTDNGRTITGGTGENGFAGGFVACPLHEDGRCMSARR